MGGGEEATKKQRIVVVGGGPAGAASAKALADAGAHVRLFEAYRHPEAIAANSPAAYVIALGARGQLGLATATGVDPLTAFAGHAVISPHVTRHPAKRVLTREPPGLIVPRKFLASRLLAVAAEAGVDVAYQHRLVDFDRARKVATFEDAQDGTRKEVPYDLLVGADGSNSKVRTLLHDKAAATADADDNFAVVRIEEDSMEYQVGVLPPSDAAAVIEGLPETSSHVWNDKTYNSMGMAFPLAQNGGLLFAIVFPGGKFAEFQERQRQDGSGYEAPLRELFPDLADAARQSLAAQLAVGVPASGGKCVWCSALGSARDGVVLVGDSGHGMWPSLGQGANCALESAGVFADTVRDLAAGKATAAGGASAWSARVVGEFQRRRHADALAAVDLTYGGIGARQVRGRRNAPLAYKLQVAGMMLLHKGSGGLVPKPALLRVMAGEPVPYVTAHRWNFRYEKWICGGLAASVAAAAAARFLVK